MFHSRRFLAIRAAALIFQKFTRGFLDRQRVKAIRKLNAAITIQKSFKRWRQQVQVRPCEVKFLTLQGLLSEPQ